MKRLALCFSASSDSMSSGQVSPFRLGIYLPVKLPQSRSRSNGVVTTSLPWPSATTRQVSTERFRSLLTNTSIGSERNDSASLCACSSPCAVS